jgi:alpha-tubulin suppressor-like RCC1 family protein
MFVAALLLLPRGEPAEANPITDIAAVAAGGNHTCALTSSDAVLCWGDNHYGQLGDGTTTDRSRPVPVTQLTSGVSAIAAGSNHTCALLKSGGVKCWGYNRYGQLGNPANVGNQASTNPNPLDVTNLQSGVTEITTGAAHSCARMNTGGVKCWGWDFAGQLGDGPGSCDAICSTPRDVSGLTSGVADVAAGLYHTCAVLVAGSVKCWGQNDFGQLGVPTGSPCFYVTLEPLPCSRSPVDVADMSNANSVAASGVYDGVTNASHSCAVLSGGGVKCWGSNGSGQLGDGGACGAACQSPVPVVDLKGDPVSGVVDVALGSQHSCYQRGDDGAVFCWGDGSDGQVGHGVTADKPRATQVCANPVCDPLHGVTSLSLGLAHSCGVLDGGVVCWGSNDFGQLGDGGGCGTTCDSPTFALSKPDLPDLVVTAVRIELETGGSCAFTSTTLGTRVEFRNAGTGDAGPFVVEFNGQQMTYSDGLAAGEDGDIWFPTNNYPGLTDVMLDATFLVTESNEDNNTFSQSVPIPTLPPTCTPTMTETPRPPTATPTPAAAAGDANCDRSINSIDAALVLQLVADLLQSLPCASAADANDDGDIDAVDAALILQYGAGLLNEL